VTPVVRSNGTYSFVLVANNADGLSMSSREGELAPRLVLPLGATGPTPTSPPNQPPGTVKPVAAAVETDPVPSGKDAADDPAIWVNPADPAQSTIIGTDKKGGLTVYDLAGNQLQYLPDGYVNNVDLRPNLPLNGQSVAVVVASNRSTNSLAIYKVDPATRRLELVAARYNSHV
jgi:3-phytase